MPVKASLHVRRYDWRSCGHDNLVAGDDAREHGYVNGIRIGCGGNSSWRGNGWRGNVRGRGDLANGRVNIGHHLLTYFANLQLQAHFGRKQVLVA